MAFPPGFWKSGWRPAVGWVCVGALICAYIVKSLVFTTVWTYQAIIMIAAWDKQAAFVLPVYPELGIIDLIGLVASMLGVSGLRTLEKLKDKA